MSDQMNAWRVTSYIFYSNLIRIVTRWPQFKRFNGPEEGIFALLSGREFAVVRFLQKMVQSQQQSLW